MARGAALLAATTALGGCGGTGPPAARSEHHDVDLSAIWREARPIGRGPRFHPPPAGPVLGRCIPMLGARYEAHVEVFAADRVVIVPAGIGTRPPREWSDGRLAGARCYGAVVTLDPTGVVLARADRVTRLAALFASWGIPLTRTRVGSFVARPGGGVEVFVGGRRRPGPPGRVALSPHAEVVVEVGPHVPPHSGYAFPPFSAP